MLPVVAATVELVALDEWVELAEAEGEAEPETVPDDVGAPIVVKICSDWPVVVVLPLLLGAAEDCPCP